MLLQPSLVSTTRSRGGGEHETLAWLAKERGSDRVALVAKRGGGDRQNIPHEGNAAVRTSNTVQVAKYGSH